MYISLFYYNNMSLLHYYVEIQDPVFPGYILLTLTPAFSIGDNFYEFVKNTFIPTSCQIFQYPVSRQNKNIHYSDLFQYSASSHLEKHYPNILSTSALSASITYAIPDISAASLVSAQISLRSICFNANLRSPAMSCCSPWVRRSMYV